jgi:hypothetical protein
MLPARKFLPRSAKAPFSPCNAPLASRLLKNPASNRFREGHDFSRAVKSSKVGRALRLRLTFWRENELFRILPDRQRIHTDIFEPENHFLATAFAPLRAPFFALSRRSITAATMIGRPTVASTKTSPNFPPSEGGTNFPHEIASL